MISSYATNTLSTTGSSTEDFLSSPNEQGRFTLQLDLNDMAAGDVIEVRAYKMVRASGTQRVCAFTAYYGAQPAYGLVVIPFDGIDNSLTDANALRYSITQTFGTAGISIPWTVLKEDALAPTTTARTLDVTATGAAGIDWGNVENPTTALNLSATNIDVDQVVASVTGAVGSVTGAVGSVTGAVGSVTGAVGSVTGAVGSVTGNVGGNVTGSVGSVAAGGITASSIADGAIDRATFTADTGLQAIRSNTAQSATGTTIVLDASASAVDDFYNSCIIYITGGTGVGQARAISDYVGATKTATVSTWMTTPDNTSTFAILPDSASSGGGGGATAADVWSYGSRTLTTSPTGVQIDPVRSAGVVEIIGGYDYTTVTGGEMDFPYTDAPDLTGGTADMVLCNPSETSIGFSTTILNAGTATQTVRVQATGAQTAALKGGNVRTEYRFRIKATLASSAQVPLSEGILGVS